MNEGEISEIIWFCVGILFGTVICNIVSALVWRKKIREVE